MSHMNIVKFLVKHVSVEEFLNIFKEATLSPGQISAKLVQIDQNKFCSIGLWDSKESMDNSMDEMISFLDTFRHMLEKISDELGVTDPASGPLVLEH